LHTPAATTEVIELAGTERGPVTQQLVSPGTADTLLTTADPKLPPLAALFTALPKFVALSEGGTVKVVATCMEPAESSTLT
jgi:hypothetical protein